MGTKEGSSGIGRGDLVDPARAGWRGCRGAPNSGGGGDHGRMERHGGPWPPGRVPGEPGEPVAFRKIVQDDRIKQGVASSAHGVDAPHPRAQMPRTRPLACRGRTSATAASGRESAGRGMANQPPPYLCPCLSPAFPTGRSRVLFNCSPCSNFSCVVTRSSRRDARTVPRHAAPRLFGAGSKPPGGPRASHCGVGRHAAATAMARPLG